jgi:hypothetical protein
VTKSFLPGRIELEIGSVSILSRADIAASNLARDVRPAGRYATTRCPLRSYRGELAQIRPSWHRKSMPESCLADANRR